LVYNLKNRFKEAIYIIFENSNYFFSAKGFLSPNRFLKLGLCWWNHFCNKEFKINELQGFQTP
jgi:hypothetical protein